MYLKRNLERVIQTLHGGERSSMYSCGSFRPTHKHVNINSAVGSQLNPYKKNSNRGAVHVRKNTHKH